MYIVHCKLFEMYKIIARTVNIKTKKYTNKMSNQSAKKVVVSSSVELHGLFLSVHNSV